MVHRPRAALLLPALLSILLLGGCGGVSPSAESQLCASINELQDAAAELRTLGLGSTRADVQESVGGLLVAVENVAEDIGGVLESDVATIRQELDALASELRGLSDQATIAEALAVVQQVLPALEAALGQVLDGADCEGFALGSGGSELTRSG